MDYADSWKPDPFGTHELRFFSADGKPTPLVMDGGKRSFDRPAAHEDPTVRPPSVETPPVETRPVEAPPVETPPIASPRTQSEIPADPGMTNSLAASMSPASVVEPISMARVDNPAAESTSAGSTMVMVDEGSQSTVPETHLPSQLGEPEGAPLQVVGDSQPEAMNRRLKIAYAVVLGLLAVSVVGVVLVHVTHQGNASVAPVTSAPTTTTSDATTTTTAAHPASLSPSAAAAADALVSSWSKNDQAGALTVATTAAVTTLFGSPYASGQAISRGCSTSFMPIVCTYGPPGGASPTDPIYQVMVSQTDGGWYVSSVRKEN
jgi:hypothetical protein